jgi:hypothetical protein
MPTRIWLIFGTEPIASRGGGEANLRFDVVLVLDVIPGGNANVSETVVVAIGDLDFDLPRDPEVC